MDGKKMCEIIEANVQELCKIAGMTLHEVSKECGVADSYFKRPHTDMPMTKVAKLASIFNVKPHQLYDEEFAKDIKKMALDVEIERLKKARDAMDNPGDFMTPPQEEK